MSTSAFSEPGSARPAAGLQPVKGNKDNRKRSSPGRLGAPQWAAVVAQVLICAAAGSAPLIVGTAHLPVIASISIVCGFAVLAATLSSAGHSGRARFSPAVVLPLSFVLLPALQLVPLPWSVYAGLDSAAAELIATAQASTLPGHQTLTLDAPSTAVALTKSTAFLAIFSATSLVTSVNPRNARPFIVVISLSGLAALVVGLAHKLWGASRVYGHFGGYHPLLNGPFVNPNHNAEFLELAAFVALSRIQPRSSRVERLAWAAAAISCAAGALSTLSRGSFLGLSCGTAVVGIAFLLRRRGASDLGVRKRDSIRRTLLIFGLFVGAIAAMAASIGAGALLERMTSQSPLGDLRFQLWKDAFAVVRTHPLGIGAGAFERVYSTVRTLQTPRALRFTHVEDLPLQILIDYGWPGAGVILIVTLIAVRALCRRNMPASSVALLAGLVAVLAHNLVDFGLDILGVALPFGAVLGALAGRSTHYVSIKISRRAAVAFGAAVCMGVAICSVTIASRFRVDYDERIRLAPAGSARQQLAQRAEQEHPLDYFYPLVEAVETPLAQGAEGRFARLRSLNRALLLCPNCSDVHTEVAQTLDSLGRSNQAITEWRIACRANSDLVPHAIDQIWLRHQNVGHLIAFAAGDPVILHNAVIYLLNVGQGRAAGQLVPDAQAAGVSVGDLTALLGRAALLEGETSRAEALLLRAVALLPDDLMLPAVLAEALQRNGKSDRSLAVLDKAILKNPRDIASARLRVAMVLSQRRWSLAEKSIDALKQSLQAEGLPTTEAHVAASNSSIGQGRWTEALSELRTALAQSPENVSMLVDYARLADGMGRTQDALAKLATAAAIAPENETVRVLRFDIERRRTQRTGPTAPSLFAVPGNETP